MLMRKILKFLAAIGGSVFALWLIAYLMAVFLIVDKRLERADAILVLSGGAVYKERALTAAELYRQGVAGQVILTNDGGQAGWSRREQRNPYFYELSRRELVKNGVPPEAVVILPELVEGTIYEARLFKGFAAANDIESAMLVTSPYHTARTQWTFERELREDAVEVGIAAPAPGEQSPLAVSWWTTGEGWRFVAGEYVKFMGYYLFY